MATAGKFSVPQVEHHDDQQWPSAATNTIATAIRESIMVSLPNARVEVEGTGGHYTIDVVADAFEGKSPLERQRLVYRSIAPLMTGASAPVHAVDRLNTRTPQR